MMTRSLKLVLSSILISLIVLGLSSPVAAQPVAPKLHVDAPSFVTVSTEFDIIISIRDIQSGWGMVEFDLLAQWDPNDLQYIECEFLGDGRGWTGDCGFPDLWGGDANGPPWTEDAAWFRIRFHCLREGPALITVSSPGNSIKLKSLTSGTTFDTIPAPVIITVNQVEPAPVGGISTPINKLEILTPYIALAGLIAVVSTVYVIKRRQD